MQALVSGWAPTGATAQTVDRDKVGGATGNFVSGTLYLRAFQARGGTVFNNLNVVSIAVETLGTHAWGAILDDQFLVQGVSADNTGAAPFAGSGTVVTFAVTNGGTYTAPYDGIYYAGVCASFTGTAPTIAASGLATGISAIAPARWGTSNTGLSTPPALLTQMTAVSGNGSYNFYAWTT